MVGPRRPVSERQGRRLEIDLLTYLLTLNMLSAICTTTSAAEVYTLIKSREKDSCT